MAVRYLCNPAANKTCKKTMCYWHNDSSSYCYETTDIRYAARDENSIPIRVENIDSDEEVKDN